MGDVDHARLHDVRVVLVSPVGFQVVSYFRDIQFASVVAGQGDDLVAGGLHGPGLVMIDVTGDRGYHALAVAEYRIHDGGVDLCAAGQEIYPGVGAAAGLSYTFCGGLTIGVGSVAQGLVHIGLNESSEHCRAGSFHVVAFEIEHMRGDARRVLSCVCP